MRPEEASVTRTTATVADCDDYLNSRTGKYEWRAVRYRAAASWLIMNGLSHDDTLLDVGAGWTEFDFCLRAEFGWRGRYIPLDGGIDGTNIEDWYPQRDYDWVVALEILEHMEDPARLIEGLWLHANRGIVLSTPNPRTTDVLGMDDTHKCEIHPEWLKSYGFDVYEASFYGQPADSLFAHAILEKSRVTLPPRPGSSR